MATPRAGVDAAKVILALAQVADARRGGQYAVVLQLELALDGGIPQPVGGQPAERGNGIFVYAVGGVGVGAAHVQAIEAVAPVFGKTVMTVDAELVARGEGHVIAFVDTVRCLASR